MCNTIPLKSGACTIYHIFLRVKKRRKKNIHSKYLGNAVTLAFQHGLNFNGLCQRSQASEFYLKFSVGRMTVDLLFLYLIEALKLVGKDGEDNQSW